MTTIAVIVEADGSGVTFASDQQVTWGNQKIANCTKVFTSGAVTFGFSGSVRDGNVLMHHLDVPEMTSSDVSDPSRYVVKRLIPAMRTALRDNGAIATKDGRDSFASHLIIAVAGVCGYIAADFSFFGAGNPFFAVGSGGDFALGAMAAGKTAPEAIEIAAKHDSYTGPIVDVHRVTWVATR